MKKSNENDAVLLARISREVFGLLVIEEIKIKARMRPLINKYKRYEWLVRWRR